LYKEKTENKNRIVDSNETEKEIMEPLEEGYSNDEITEGLKEDGFSGERINHIIVEVKQNLKESRNRYQEHKDSGMRASPSNPSQVNESFEDSPASNKVSEE
jgi:hypothetical protein